MSFFDNFDLLKTVEGFDPFSGVTRIFAPELSPILSNKQEINRTMMNNRELQDTVNNPTEPEISQAQKINNFIENNKVMIGGSFALVLIFLLLR